MDKKRPTATWLIALCGLLCALSWACASDEADGGGTTSGASAIDPTTANAYRELLAGVAGRVIVPTYEGFHEATLELVEATEAYAAGGDVAELESARLAYHTAMDLWQRAEVLQIGPAGSMSSVLGGEDRRNEIYSWPSVNPCRVDQEVVEEAYLNPDAFIEELPNVRGLDALEYLLFPPMSGNSCKSSSSINEDGDWDALVASGELEANRASYAATLAKLLSADAKALLERWTDGEDAFSAALASAGDGSAVYGTSHDGLNAVSDAMFYVEEVTKDMKLALPAGVSGCAEETCPGDLESQHASRSGRNVLQNLLGLQAVFLGGSADTAQAYGFDDLLAEIGNGELAADMKAALAEAITAASDLGDSHLDVLEEEPERLAALHGKLKVFGDLLKTEFVATFDLALPMSAAGDND